MADKYTVSGNRYDKGGALVMQPDPAKGLDRETNYLTQGFSDIYQETNEMKNEVARKDYNKKVVKRQGYFKSNNQGLSKEASAVLRLVKRNRAGIPFALLSSEVANRGEKELVSAVKNQEQLSVQAKENLYENAESAFNGMTKEERVLKQDTFMQDVGKIRSSLLEEIIAHRNVIDEITGEKGEFHADFYDLLYHPETGVYMKPEDQRTEFEKNFILGYSQDLVKLGKQDDIKIAKELMMKSENFVKWWNLGKMPSAISVERDGAIIPRLIHHGTLGSVSPLIGFWDRHMGMDVDVLSGMREIEKEVEKGSHFGTLNQAIERVLDKQGDGSLQQHGRSKWDKLQNVIYSPESGTKEAKFYSGFIKMNNPLRTKDLGGFEMDTILKFLSGTNFNKDVNLLYYEKDKKSLMPDFTYSILSPTDPDFTKSIDSLEDFQNDGTQFPLLVDHFGQGTAIEQVLNHARDIYEEDMNKVGYSLDDWNEEWDSMSSGTKAAIHYYKMHGLIKFINEDLGYDGIIYENTNEDARVDKQDNIKGDDSYILFHPWQFKSMYNNRDFKWGRRNPLGKTNGKNKYKKVA
jgi:hypothetical protein